MTSLLVKTQFKIDKLILFLALILLFLIDLRVLEIIWTSYKAQWILGLLTLALIAFSSFIFSRMRSSTNVMPYLLAILGVFFVLRIYWIWLVPTPLFSDFETYNRLARFFMVDNSSRGNLSWGFYTYSFGYPLALSIWYSIAGDSLFFAKLFNLLLGATTLIMFYRLGAIKDRRLGLICAFLFAIWPAQIAYTNNIASEHLALLFSIIVLCLFFWLESSGHPVIVAAILGVFLLAAYITRGQLIILSLVIIGFLFLSFFPNKKEIMKMGTVLIGFLGFYLFYIFMMSLVYGVHVRSQGFSTLLMGTNFESQGLWNPEDGSKYVSFSNLEDANRYALNESIARIQSAPKGFVLLMVKKVFIFWETENYGVDWSTSQIEGFPQTRLQSISTQAAEATADFFHFFMIFLAMITLFREVLKPHVSKHVVFMALLVLSGTFLHTIVEAQPRYHYWMEAILIYLSALTLLKLAQVKIHGIQFSIKVSGS